MSSTSEYLPEPTPGYAEERDEDYDPHGPAPTQVTMVTEEAFPYAVTAESHYAKEDTDSMQARRGPFPATLFGFSVANVSPLRLWGVISGPPPSGVGGWR